MTRIERPSLRGAQRRSNPASDAGAAGLLRFARNDEDSDLSFLIGLSNVESDRGRNLQLLKERSWFDIPLVYSNQRRAIVALEKGAPGERAFADAFNAWQQ